MKICVNPFHPCDPRSINLKNEKFQNINCPAPVNECPTIETRITQILRIVADEDLCKSVASV